jgi:ABC-type tungstate transport system permease subunit
MVEGHPTLQRPVVAAIASADKLPGTRTFEARKLMQFLTSPKTQEWIGAFGKGKVDGRSLFIPVPADFRI